MMRNKQFLAWALLLVIYCISIAHAVDQLDADGKDTTDKITTPDNNNNNINEDDKPATTSTIPYHGPAPINSQQKVDNIGHNPSMPKTTNIFKPTLSPARPNGYDNDNDKVSEDDNSNTNHQAGNTNNSPSSPVNSSNEKQIPKKHTDMQYLIKRKAYEKERRYYVDPLAQMITDITTTSKELQSATDNKEVESVIQELKAKHDKANERLTFYQYNDDILNQHQLIEQKEADIRWEIEKLEEKQVGGKYYNDIDTLIKVRRKQRKERDEMYRKRIDDIIASGNYRKGPRSEKNSVQKMKQQQQQQPTSQPTTSSSTSNEKAPTQTNKQQYYTYEQTYNTIFQPQLEEYDLLKFDPYSLSGAPIGGWGRATRSRLASLPIRLVSDFENGDGFNLWYSSDNEDVKEEEDTEDEEEKQETASEDKGEESKVSGSSAGQQTSKKKTPPKDIKKSIGPHFTIHDGAGQKYICRVYAEDELIVLSRLDSVFHPAITIWDTDSEYNNIDDEEEQAKMEKMAAANDLLNGMNNQDGGVQIKKKFQFSINGNSPGGVGAGGNDSTEDLPEGIRSSVAKMLRKMGMNDAAEALANQQANGNGDGLDVEVDVIVADMTGGEGGDILNNIAGGDDNMNNLADIIKAAAVGASAGNKDNKKTSSSQLNNEQIYQILQSLKGLCSQLHTGWWSYEWCHQEQLRQFHVAVSNMDPAQTQYEIQDVTLVGKYGGELQIIYPKGTYNGKFMKGTTTTVQYDNKGVPLKTTIKRHNSQDDRLYSSHFALDTMDKKKGQQKSNTMTENRGPIISQVFEGGDFCEEVGYNRQLQVDLLCCTESEIDNWLESKKSTKEKRQQHNQEKEPIPQAVLVSVKEEDTCIYRSRVCTPLLCPGGSDTSKVVSSTKPDIKKTSASQPTQATDPIGTLLNAIFDDEMVENGEVQVFFPDDIVGGEFDELVALAENGGDIMNSPLFQRVKEALQKGNTGNKQLIKDLLSDDTVGGNTVVTSTGSGNARAAGVMEVKKGESIREILDKVLSKRPCLMKNLGWWTYEFCHTKKIRQYHANNVIDSSTGMAKQRIETEHILGVYKDSGNTVEDYPNEKEYLHVVNATGSNAADLAIGKRKKPRAQNHANKKGQQPGGNGAVYEQEYKHGELCDHEDVAESVIKGGNILEGSVERSSTVRFSCGDRWEMIDIKEDSTCHYILDVTVPELCQHPLFQAPVTKTQVVKCLPVEETG